MRAPIPAPPLPEPPLAVKEADSRQYLLAALSPNGLPLPLPMYRAVGALAPDCPLKLREPPRHSIPSWAGPRTSRSKEEAHITERDEIRKNGTGRGGANEERTPSYPL